MRTKKIGIIGDIHFKNARGYAEYISDKRISEQRDALDFIVQQLSDCESIVLMGDSLDGKNNQSHVISQFVEFIERFNDQKLYILCGNHEKCGGKSAIDFLNEISNKHWTVFINKVQVIDKMVFLPFFFQSELGVEDHKIATKRVLDMLPEGDVLFAHHAISESRTNSGITTDVFSEVVLPRNILEKKYKMVVAGHIHTPDYKNKTIITGSVFNDEVGETGKYIWKINVDDFSVEKIPIPGRKIYKLTDPKEDNFTNIEKSSIIKVVITEKKDKKSMEALKEKLRLFDAYILLEQVEHERKKIHFEEGMLEFSVNNLLEIYAKERGVDIKKLHRGFDLLDI